MQNLPDPEEHPTVPLWPTAAKALGLGRNSAYAAAARGELPGTFKIGARYVVATAALRRALGLPVDRDAVEAEVSLD